MENTDKNKEQLQTLLIGLNKQIKELKSIREQLWGVVQSIDQALGNAGVAWEKKSQEFIAQLVAELKKENFELTSEEINSLQYNSSTASSLAETLKGIAEKHGVKVPEKSSYLTIVAYEAIIAVYRRNNLTDFKESHDIIKKLEALDQEKDASDQIKEQYKKQLKQTLENVYDLEKVVAATSGLTAEQEDLAEKIQLAVNKLTVLTVTPEEKAQLALQSSGGGAGN